jgi:hypothetical protein
MAHSTNFFIAPIEMVRNYGSNGKERSVEAGCSTLYLVPLREGSVWQCVSCGEVVKRENGVLEVSDSSFPSSELSVTVLGNHHV